jgi:hypothetical protein
MFNNPNRNVGCVRKGGGYDGKQIGILNCFYLTEERFYLYLLGNAKPRVVEYDYQGIVRGVYEIYDETADKEIIADMAVIEIGEDRIFYLVEGYPEARIDVYKVISSE